VNKVIAFADGPIRAPGLRADLVFTV